MSLIPKNKMETQKQSLLVLVLDVLGLNSMHTEWIKKIKLLPVAEDDWCEFLDEVCEFTSLSNNKKVHNEYESILMNSSDSFVCKIAKEKYQNIDFWIEPYKERIPKYLPSLHNVYTFLEDSSSKDISLENIVQKQLTDFMVNHKTNPPYYDLKYDESLISIELKFERLINIPVNFVGWFSAPFIIKSFQDKDKMFGTYSWEEFFGKEGSLRKFRSGLLVATNIILKITTNGDFNEKIVQDFQTVDDLFTCISSVDGQNNQILSYSSIKNKPILLAHSYVDILNLVN